MRVWMLFACVAAVWAAVAVCGAGAVLPPTAVVLLDVDVLSPEAVSPTEVRVFSGKTYTVQVFAYVRVGGVDQYCTGSGCTFSFAFSDPMGTSVVTTAAASIALTFPFTFAEAGVFGLNVSAVHPDSGAVSVNEDDTTMAYLPLDRSIVVVDRPVAVIAAPSQATVSGSVPLTITVSATGSSSATTFHSVALSPSAHLIGSIGADILTERIDGPSATFAASFVAEHLLGGAATTYSLVHTVTSTLGGRNTTTWSDAITVYPAPAVALSVPAATTVSTLALPVALSVDPGSGSTPYTYSLSVWSQDLSVELVPAAAFVANATTGASQRSSDVLVNATTGLSAFLGWPAALPLDIVVVASLADAYGVSPTSPVVSSPVRVNPIGVFAALVSSTGPAGVMVVGVNASVSVSTVSGGTGPFTYRWTAVRAFDGAVFELAESTHPELTGRPASSWLRDPTAAEPFNVTVTVTDAAGVAVVVVGAPWDTTTVRPAPVPTVRLSAGALSTVSITGSLSVAVQVVLGGQAPYTGRVELRPVAAPTTVAAAWDGIALPSAGTEVVVRVAVPDSVAPATSGYFLAASVTGAMGGTGSDLNNTSSLVTVTAAPTPTVAVTSSATVTEGQNVTLDVSMAGGTGSGTPVALVVSLVVAGPGGAVLDSNLASVTVDASSLPLTGLSVRIGERVPGASLLTGGVVVVQVVVTATDASGAVGSGLSGPVTLSPQLTGVVGSVNGVDGASIGTLTTFTVVPSGGSGTLGYAWSLVYDPDGARTVAGLVGNTASVSTVIAGPVGNYSIEVELSDAAGERVTVQRRFEVAAAPSLVLDSVTPARVSETSPIDVGFGISDGIGPYTVSLGPLYGASSGALVAGGGASVVPTFTVVDRGTGQTSAATIPVGLYDAAVAAGVVPDSDGGVELSTAGLLVGAGGGAASAAVPVSVWVYSQPGFTAELSPSPVGNGNAVTVTLGSGTGGAPGAVWTIHADVVTQTGTAAGSASGAWDTASEASTRLDVDVSVPEVELASGAATGLAVNVTVRVVDGTGGAGHRTLSLVVVSGTAGFAGSGSSNDGALEGSNLIVVAVVCGIVGLCCLLLLLWVLLFRSAASVDDDSRSGSGSDSELGSLSETVKEDRVLGGTELGELFADVMDAVENAEAHLKRKARAATSLSRSSLAISDDADEGDDRVTLTLGTWSSDMTLKEETGSTSWSG